MPKRSSNKTKKERQPPPDENEAARSVLDGIAARTEVDDVVASPPARKNPAAVALGRLGGIKGGPARAASLTPEERQRIAKEAARVRWSQKEK